MLLVDNANRFLVLTGEKQWSELKFARFKQDIRLVNSTDDEEVLGDVLRWDSKEPS